MSMKPSKNNLHHLFLSFRSIFLFSSVMYLQYTPSSKRNLSSKIIDKSEAVYFFHVSCNSITKLPGYSEYKFPSEDDGGVEGLCPMSFDVFCIWGRAASAMLFPLPTLLPIIANVLSTWA